MGCVLGTADSAAWTGEEALAIALLGALTLDAKSASGRDLHRSTLLGEQLDFDAYPPD